MKYLVMAILAVMMTGCLEYTGDTAYDQSVDNSVDNGDYRSYVCTENNNTDCYSADYTYYTDSNGSVDDVADEPSGVYDATYDAAECAANGYFFCSISQTCLNLPASSGSCN